MSEGFTVRGFLVAADDKTRNARLKFNEVDWVDFLDEQFPLGGEVYISAVNPSADLAAALNEGDGSTNRKGDEMKPMKKIINGMIDGINEDNVKEIVQKDAEISALREALDTVRWPQAFGNRYCAECGRRIVDPEVHAPDCKIGKLFAGKKAAGS